MQIEQRMSVSWKYHNKDRVILIKLRRHFSLNGECSDGIRGTLRGSSQGSSQSVEVFSHGNALLIVFSAMVKNN